jgi:hypothetical protein
VHLPWMKLMEANRDRCLPVDRIVRQEFVLEGGEKGLTAAQEDGAWQVLKRVVTRCRGRGDRGGVTASCDRQAKGDVVGHKEDRG